MTCRVIPSAHHLQAYYEDVREIYLEVSTGSGWRASISSLAPFRRAMSLPETREDDDLEYVWENRVRYEETDARTVVFYGKTE